MENINKKIILVVEDELPLSDAIKLKLEKNNFHAVTARTVEQAKGYAMDLERIDAIWLDHYLLGKENGLDFLFWCKSDGDSKCKNIPVFVVSNTASSDKVTTYMNLGINKYYIKANHRLDEIVADIVKATNSDKI